VAYLLCMILTLPNILNNFKRGDYELLGTFYASIKRDKIS
jgi:hypothetical protein